MTSGLLFEFQHMKCMDTDLIRCQSECETITDKASLANVHQYYETM